MEKALQCSSIRVAKEHHAETRKMNEVTVHQQDTLIKAGKDHCNTVGMYTEEAHPERGAVGAGKKHSHWIY